MHCARACACGVSERRSGRDVSTNAHTHTQTHAHANKLHSFTATPGLEPSKQYALNVAAMVLSTSRKLNGGNAPPSDDDGCGTSFAKGRCASASAAHSSSDTATATRSATHIMSKTQVRVRKIETNVGFTR